MRLFFASCLLALLPACSFMTEDDDYYVGGSGSTTPPALGCDPLPAPTGPVVPVTPAQASELPSLVASAPSGTTLALEPGTYVISEELVFATPGVSLRSATNDAGSVTIDGQRNTNLVRVNASDITLAHVTLTRGSEIAVLLQPGPGITGFSMHGVRIIDGGAEFLRAERSPVPGYVDSATITCSDFQLTGELRADVCCPDCVLLGMNVFGGRNWVLRGSRFQDLNCAENTPQAPPFAVLFRGGVRDALIENNSFWNPERGLGLGFDTGTDPQRSYPDAYGGLALDFIDGIVRNNVIFSNQSSFDTGIEINDARQPLVIHNTIVYTDGYRSIDWRYADTRATVANNLVKAMGPRDEGQATTTTNLENTPLEYFANPTGFDFHLLPGATGAIDQGTPFAESGTDLDGEPHGQTPDIGADER